jgi:hypothetical protein
MTVDGTALIYNIITEHLKLVACSRIVLVVKTLYLFHFSALIKLRAPKMLEIVSCVWIYESYHQVWENLAAFSSFFGALVHRKNVRLFRPLKMYPGNFNNFLCHKLSSFNFRFTSVIRLKIVWKIREILQFHNKCSTHFGSFSFHWSFPMHIGWEMLRNWGFSKKITHKTSSGRKTYNWRALPYQNSRILSYHSWKLVNGFGLHTRQWI